MTSYQKKTEKQKERAEILFKEYPGIHMAYGLSETKKADSKLNRLPSRRTFALTPKKRRLSTLPLLRSTIDVVGLNFSVRNGKRWIPNAITTLITFYIKIFDRTTPS